MSEQRTIIIVDGDTPVLENEIRRFSSFENGFNIQYVSNERQEPNKLIGMKHGKVNEKNVIKNCDY